MSAPKHGGWVDEYPINKRLVGALLADKAMTLGDNVFFYYRNMEVSYGKLNERSNRVGNGLRELGVNKGDKVCVIMATCPECLYVWFGLSKIGAVEASINTAYKGDLLQYLINISDAETIILDEDLLDNIKFIENDLIKIRRLIIRPKEGGRKKLNPTRFEGISFEELFKGSEVDPKVESHVSDLAYLLFTSGTTGLSKAVMLSVNIMYRLGTTHAEVMRYDSRDVLYNYLPFFHIAARFLTLGGLLVGAKMVLQERFSVSEFWGQVRKYGVTSFFSVGAMMHMLYSQPEGPDDGNNPLKKGYCIPIPKEFYKDFMRRFNVPTLIEAYGGTETGHVTIVPWDETWREGSCGKRNDACEAIVADENDYELPPGEVGEILMRQKEPFAMMSGYYKMPEETLRATRNFWFHTGDRGYVDNDGWFYFVDRAKDCIRRRGENISSFEVERVISSHPMVAESAVFPVPSEVGEDEVMAAIVLRQNAKIAPEELIAFCEDRMAYFAIPRFVDFRESLPKTPTEKIEKYKLRKEGVSASTWDRVKAGYRIKKG